MNFSSTYRGRQVAVVQSTDDMRCRGMLQMFETESGKRIAQFPVRYDHGGERLSLARDEDLALVGCYEAFGLAAYHLNTGAEHWRRRDLKQVQNVSCSPHSDVAFCGREGAGHLISTKTGETLQQFRGIKSVYWSPFAGACLVGARDLEFHEPLGTRKGKIKRTTFAELDVAFARDCFLTTESGGPVRCFDMESLRELWSYKPTQAMHVAMVGYCETTQLFVGVEHRRPGGGKSDPFLLHWNPKSGAILKELAIAQHSPYVFCNAGAIAVCWKGDLISTSDGRNLRFLFGD